MLRDGFLSVVLSVCGAVGAGVLAQPATAATAAAVVAQNDADKDQTLDLAEVKTAAGAHFDKLNKDGDSTLEAGEVKGVVGARMFKKADTDNDGSISKDEYLAVVETLFKRADSDNDGTLSVSELKSKPARQLKRLIE
jgi:Ca2+-binding EF-hand superfamily protein